MIDRIKSEPAILVGLVTSVVAVVVQAVTGDITWAAAVPLIAGVITRFFVSPA